MLSSIDGYIIQDVLPVTLPASHNLTFGGATIDASEKVSPLKKVYLSLEAGTAPLTMDLTDGPLAFDFIIGIGKGGMAPLEIQLMDKQPGDSIQIHLHGDELPVLLDHLVVSFPFKPQSEEAFYLKLDILDVKTPESREVVRAMATATSCGAGCCGHHD